MAWEFLRRLLKFMGGKVMGKLAPRLIFFQYYDRAGLQLQQQRKRFRILYQKSPAQLLLFEYLTNKPQYRIGVASILQDRQIQNQHQYHVMDVREGQQLWDMQTISSHQDDIVRQQEFLPRPEWQIVQVDRSYVRDV